MKSYSRDLCSDFIPFSISESAFTIRIILTKNSIDKVTFAMYDLKHKLNHIKHINKL